jgi:hypothetical protein
MSCVQCATCVCDLSHECFRKLEKLLLHGKKYLLFASYIVKIGIESHRNIKSCRPLVLTDKKFSFVLE